MQKKRARLLALSCFSIVALAACENQPPADALITKVVEFVAAFNARDPAAMVAMTSDDVRWLNVDGAEISVEVEGRDALMVAMTDYFTEAPRSPSRMRFVQRDGEYVFGVEEIMRGPTNEGRNQCSVVVYQFSGSLIQNVWYHPAYKC